MNKESQVLEIYVSDIIPNRFQPRLSFNEQKLNDLAQSIKHHGIIQPLVLRKVGEKYEIIAGERRYKAAISIGLNKVPAIITDLDDNQSAEIALVENLQRKDLTSIEEAKSFKKLLDRGYLTQEQLAEKMGISQSAVANKIRLLNLSEEVQEALLYEKISERHARSLLAITNKEEQQRLLNKIQKERLTVRQLDREIESLIGGKADEVEKMEKIEKKETTEVFELPKTFIDAPPTLEIEKPAVEITEEIAPQVQGESGSQETISDIEKLLNNKEQEEINFFNQPETEEKQQNNDVETTNIFDFPSLEEMSKMPEEDVNNSEIKEKPKEEPAQTEIFNIDDMFSNQQTIEPITDLDTKITKQLPENQPIIEERALASETTKIEPVEKISDALENLKADIENPKPQFIEEKEAKEQEPIQRVELKIDKSNFRTVEGAFENLKQEIIAAGLKIDMDTYNFEQYYQLIIKVYK